jgi:hypothetical protein
MASIGRLVPAPLFFGTALSAIYRRQDNEIDGSDVPDTPSIATQTITDTAVAITVSGMLLTPRWITLEHLS